MRPDPGLRRDRRRLRRHASRLNFGAQEVCVPQHRDEDCDGSADDADPSAVGKVTWLADGFGDPGATLSSCDPPQGYAATGGDCDDTRPGVNPGAQEVCDPQNLDEDCDGRADDADPSAVGNVTWFADGDADGFGDPGATLSACDPPGGFIADNQDCNDGNGAIHPGATEIVNLVDDDCDGAIDDAP